MTKAEAKLLEIGSPVKWKMKSTWIHGTFKGLHEYTTFKTMTYNDLLTGNFNITSGKLELRATVEYTDDNIRTYTTNVSIRSLHCDKED